MRRIRTNTPLQALVTLNDIAFIETAGGLGEAGRMPEAPAFASIWNSSGPSAWRSFDRRSEAELGVLEATARGADAALPGGAGTGRWP